MISAEKTQILPNQKSANQTQTKELVMTITNAGITMQPEVPVNYSVGEDVPEIGYFWGKKKNS